MGIKAPYPPSPYPPKGPYDSEFFGEGCKVAKTKTLKPKGCWPLYYKSAGDRKVLNGLGFMVHSDFSSSVQVTVLIRFLKGLLGIKCSRYTV